MAWSGNVPGIRAGCWLCVVAEVRTQRQLKLHDSDTNLRTNIVLAAHFLMCSSAVVFVVLLLCPCIARHRSRWRAMAPAGLKAVPIGTSPSEHL